jgi:hypothetical protein
MRRLILVSLASAISLALIGPAAGAPAFPDQIPVPDGFFPEGIAVGHGHDFYVGSLLDGARGRNSPAGPGRIRVLVFYVDVRARFVMVRPLPLALPTTDDAAGRRARWTEPRRAGFIGWIVGESPGGHDVRVAPVDDVGVARRPFAFVDYWGEEVAWRS